MKKKTRCVKLYVHTTHRITTCNYYYLIWCCVVFSFRSSSSCRTLPRSCVPHDRAGYDEEDWTAFKPWQKVQLTIRRGKCVILWIWTEWDPFKPEWIGSANAHDRCDTVWGGYCTEFIIICSPRQTHCLAIGWNEVMKTD